MGCRSWFRTVSLLVLGGDVNVGAWNAKPGAVDAPIRAKIRVSPVVVIFFRSDITGHAVSKAKPRFSDVNGAFHGW